MCPVFAHRRLKAIEDFKRGRLRKSSDYSDLTGSIFVFLKTKNGRLQELVAKGDSISFQLLNNRL